MVKKKKKSYQVIIHFYSRTEQLLKVAKFFAVAFIVRVILIL